MTSPANIEASLALFRELDCVFPRVYSTMKALGLTGFTQSRGFLYAALMNMPGVPYELTETYLLFPSVDLYSWYFPLTPDKERISKDLSDIVARGIEVPWYVDLLPSLPSGSVVSRELYAECEVETSSLKFEGGRWANRRKEINAINSKTPILASDISQYAAKDWEDLDALEREWWTWRNSRGKPVKLWDQRIYGNMLLLAHYRPDLYDVRLYRHEGVLKGYTVTAREGHWWTRLLVRTLPDISNLHVWAFKNLQESLYSDLALENDGDDDQAVSLAGKTSLKSMLTSKRHVLKLLTKAYEEEREAGS